MSRELLDKLVQRIEALEVERLLKSQNLPIPDTVSEVLNNTSDAVQEVKRLDWVKNIGI